MPFCAFLIAILLATCGRGPWIPELHGQETFAEFSTEPPPDQSRRRIRIMWGGGRAAAWRGSMTLSDGELDNLVPLGMDFGSGAALRLYPQSLALHTLNPTDINGCDVDVVESEGLQLTIHMRAPGSANSSLHRTVDLHPLFDPSSGSPIQLILDDTGNRLDIRTAPGDELPVTVNREHLIFDPQEVFEFHIRPFRGTGELGATGTVKVELIESGTTASLFRSEIRLRSNGQHYVPTESVSINMPKEQGVYDIRLSWQNASLASRFGIQRKELKRTIQVVVVDRQGETVPDDPDQIKLWAEVFNSEQMKQRWTDRIPALPQFKRASSSSSLNNSGVESVEIDGATWTEFQPGGWQAVPLEIAQLNRPHIVEIEFRDEGPMRMGISLLQPDPNGQVKSFGVDSGIYLPDSRSVDEGSVRRHRIFFWPSHKRPYLLFANRHDSQPARIGTVRVLAGPSRLATADSVSSGVVEDLPHRHYWSFYEKPLFAENFAAPQAADEETGQTWQDWRTFYAGANRWIQYLKANGYTGAMVVVAGDGSALYPSAQLQPTPRFDNGVFAPTASDPIRKDVVELLLRMFQRDGLTLVPVFHFNAPLPELERMRLESPEYAEGILLTDLQGHNRLTSRNAQSEPGSLYNPLDERVQAAYTAVVKEFVNRYRGHSAIGGLGFLYSRDALQVLPGQTWGVDAQTLRQFAEEKGTAIDSSRNGLVELFNDMARRQAWLKWRQERMASWLDQLKLTTQDIGKIHVLATDLLQTQDAFSAIAPSLRRNGDLWNALARVGLPVEYLQQSQDIVFFRPRELAPERSLARNRLNIELSHSEEFSEVFRDLGVAGTLFSHRYSWAEFDQLTEQNIFGQSQIQSIMRLQPLAPAGAWNRQRLAASLARHDDRYLVEGGWLSRFGQEEHVAEFVEVFTGLPHLPFEDVVAESESDTSHGIVVRKVATDNHRWFYVVNPTPWTIQVSLKFSGRNTVIESLGPSEILFDEDAEEPITNLEMKPFSIQAGWTNKRVQLTGFEAATPENVVSELQGRLNGLLTRVSRAAEVEPIDVLDNPGFEKPGVSGDAPNEFGWHFDNRLNPFISLTRDQAFNGQAALELVSNGDPVWVRSNEFSAPETGRLSISVMIRSRQPEVQPHLRLSIQGNDGRDVYYRYGMVGGDTRQVTSEWQEFAVHFDDLPLQPDTPLQIGFDLMAAGEVEIDRVRVYDRWLDTQDSRALTQILALAGFHLTQRQNVNRCRRILDGYWPRFLQEFFSEESEDDQLVEEKNVHDREARASKTPQNRASESSSKR